MTKVIGPRWAHLIGWRHWGNPERRRPWVRWAKGAPSCLIIEGPITRRRVWVAYLTLRPWKSRADRPNNYRRENP